MISRSETVIYVPHDADQQERWDIVAASLKAAGFTNIVPAPMAAQNFKPRHARMTMPLMISRAEA
jgi:hypothetical protein